MNDIAGSTGSPGSPGSAGSAPAAARADVRRSRRAFIAVGVILPIVVTVIGVVLMLAWLPSLPDPVAIHWGASGEPNGFAAPWVNIVLTLAVGLGLTALFTIPVLIASRDGEWGVTMRFLGAMSAGTTTYIVLLVTWSTGMQRGLDDARDASGIFWPLVGGLAVGIVVGLGAWFVQPDLEVSGGRGVPMTQVGAIALAPGERVVWLRTVTLPRAGMIAIVSATVALAIAALWLGVTGGELAWVCAALALLFLVLLLTTSVFRVRVDEAGLTVRSPLAVPRWRIPLDEIDEVEVARVEPMVQFGGYGIRLSIDGRFGVVLRKGDAIQVARRGKRPFVVTVADAATGAAVLQVLRERSAR